MQLDIRFGAMADQLLEQVRRQHNGYIDIDHVAICQKDADAVTRLDIRRLIGAAATRTARQRIMRAVVRACIQSKQPKGDA